MISTGLRIGDPISPLAQAPRPSAPTVLADASLPTVAGDAFVRGGANVAPPRVVGAATDGGAPVAKPLPVDGAGPAVAGSLAGGPAAAVAAASASIADARPLDPKKVMRVEQQIEGIAGAREQMSALSPTERDGFLRLATKLYDPGIFLFRQGGTTPNMLTLLASGRLRDTDSRGATLLDNLTAMASQPLAKGFENDYMRGEVLDFTVAALAHPDGIEQGSHGTCTATTVEYAYAKHYPAEYVRLLSGLFDPQGEVAMRNGEILQRASNIHYNDDSRRTPVSRVFQSAIMDYANGPLTYYDNYKDLNTPLQARDVALHGTYKGLFPWEVKRALEALTPYRYDTPLFRNEEADRTDFRRRVAEAPADQPLPLSIRWCTPKPLEAGLHMLLLERVDDQYAYLRNPQGTNEDADLGDPALDLAPRELVGEKGSGHIRMPLDTFYDRLYSYFAPSDAKAPPTDTVRLAG